jgi:hypothetical protein
MMVHDLVVGGDELVSTPNGIVEASEEDPLPQPPPKGIIPP